MLVPGSNRRIFGVDSHVGMMMTIIIDDFDGRDDNENDNYTDDDNDDGDDDNDDDDDDDHDDDD